MEQEDARLSAQVAERRALEAQVTTLKATEAQLKADLERLQTEHAPLQARHGELSASLRELRQRHEDEEGAAQTKVRASQLASVACRRCSSRGPAQRRSVVACACGAEPTQPVHILLFWLNAMHVLLHTLRCTAAVHDPDCITNSFA